MFIEKKIKYMQSNYENVVVNKPWGYEYLAYQNKDVALWLLFIKFEHETSLHCHPNKDTGLIVLDGKVNVSFLNDVFYLDSGRKIMIRKGLFHSTKTLSKEGAFVFEIETPVNKHDIIRLDDKYGRVAKPYEGKSYEEKKSSDCLWFEEPEKNLSNIYSFANCKIKICSISNYKQLLSINDYVNVMFLKGGIMCGKNKVANPGDVIAAHIIKRLLNTFRDIHEDTLILTIESK
jgi:mannose-6-phosphate isomerase-like protein (cupin superfamily)